VVIEDTVKEAHTCDACHKTFKWFHKFFVTSDRADKPIWERVSKLIFSMAKLYLRVPICSGEEAIIYGNDRKWKFMIPIHNWVWVWVCGWCLWGVLYLGEGKPWEHSIEWSNFTVEREREKSEIQFSGSLPPTGILSLSLSLSLLHPRLIENILLGRFFFLSCSWFWLNLCACAWMSGV